MYTHPQRPDRKDGVQKEATWFAESEMLSVNEPSAEHTIPACL